MMDGLAGKTFGRLTVLDRATNDSHGNIRFRCMCKCGCETVVTASHLKAGHTRSCGCLIPDTTSARVTKHGWGHTRLYRIWSHMKEQCLNPNSISYKNYGGRGITVCNEWKQDFTAFRDWAMENGYSDELQIDRIDNFEGYFPDNCRWSTRAEQSLNRRSNRFLEYGGKRQTIKEWALEIGISHKILYDRIKSGWSVERALTERKKGEAHGQTQ